MPSDASIYNLANQPTTALLNPLDIRARKNALALQAQQIQGGDMALQQQQREITADANFRALVNQQGAAPAPAAAAGGALPFSLAGGVASPIAQAGAAPAPAPAAAPSGAPPTAAHNVSDDQILGTFGAQKGYALIHARAEANNLAATTAETQNKLELGNRDYWGSLARGIQESNYDPGVIQASLSLAASHGKQNSPEYQLLAQNASNPNALKQLTQTALQNSPDQQKLISERMTASAATITAEEKKQSSDREAATAARSQALSALSAAPNSAQYGAIWQKLPPDLRDDQSIPNPMQWTAQTPAMLQRAGQTTNEQVTTAQAAKRDANTAANERTARGQEQQRIALEQGNQKIAKAAADPYGVLGINPNPIGGGRGNLTGQAFLDTLPTQFAGTIKAVAEGRQTNLPRGGKELDQIMGAVNQYDPSYSVQRGQTRTAFQTGAQGRNIGNLNTAVVHLDQYHEVMKAMNNGSFQPGNQIYNWAAEKFGNAAVTNPDFVRQSLAGEAANALKGNATDPEIAGVMKTLGKNQSPAQQEGTALEGLKILGTKLNTYDEQYQQVSPGDPWTPVLPTARAVFARYGIQPLTRTGAASAPAAAAGAPAPAVARAPAAAAAGNGLQHKSTAELLGMLNK